jgi:hypothetical protein
MLFLTTYSPGQGNDSQKRKRVKAEIKIGDDGIIRLEVKADAEIETEDAQKIIQAFHRLMIISDKDKFLLLSDARLLHSASAGSRKLFSSDVITRHIRANAIIVDSLPVRLIANFFISFHKPKSPTQIFNTEQEAIQWLKGFEKLS